MLFSRKVNPPNIAIATVSALIALSNATYAFAQSKAAQPAAAAATSQPAASDAAVDAARDSFMEALRLEAIREDDRAVGAFENTCRIIRSSPDSFDAHFKYRVGTSYSRLLLRHGNREKAQPIEDEFCAQKHWWNRSHK